MMHQPKRIAVIGMGIMGSAMAVNLLHAGFQVGVYNRTPEKTKTAVDAGATSYDTIASAAKDHEVILFMLSDGDAVAKAVESCREELTDEKVVVNMSTLSRDETQGVAATMQEVGVPFVDAPVSGSKKPAEDGTLVVLAGGDREVVDWLEPVFSAVGKKTVYAGEVPQGTMMKLTINLLLGVCMEGLSEAVAFGEDGGLDAQTIMEVVNAGALACPLFQVKTGMMQDKTFSAQFPLKHMAKDFRCISEVADANQSRLFLGAKAAQQYDDLQERYGEEDVAAIYRAYRT